MADDKPTSMNRRTFLSHTSAALGGWLCASGCSSTLSKRGNARTAPTSNLVGYWPMRGDAQDRSGHGHHGRIHGSGAADGQFDGRGSFIEIPPCNSLNLGRDDFTLSAWVWSAPDTEDVHGDILTQFDPVRRRGFNFGLKASAGGYSAQGDDRHVFFGIDDGRVGPWEDCGRPSPTSNYVSNSLTVFNGDLYAAITDAVREEDWSHVFRYRGGQSWEDCGRVGKLKARGVGPMIAHRGHLYAATWNYDWTRVGIVRPDRPPYEADSCRVYRYAGGTRWEDCGQPGQCRRLFGLASFRGRLYVTAEDGRCYVYDGERTWTECGHFTNYGHPMGIHNGKLYGGSIPRSEVFRYDDGTAWAAVGRFLDPADYQFRNPNEWARVTSLTVYGGKLFASMGSCTSSHLDAPADFRGRVYAMTAGQCVSYDHDLGPGWKHLVAIRRGERLELYLNGSRNAESAGLGQAAFDLSTNAPLRIGAGETDSFSGRIREVQLHRGALSAGEIHRLATPDHHPEAASTTA